MIGVITMPKKADPTLKTESGIYRSQIRQNEKFEERFEKIIVRVPEGSRAAITKYVEEKAEAEPENLKYSSYNGKAYRPSVNALIRSLIEDEMGVNLDELKASE
jgi:hypothetical protein